jgi:hypothetical protein
MGVEDLVGLGEGDNKGLSEKPPYAPIKLRLLISNLVMQGLKLRLHSEPVPSTSHRTGSE